MSMEHLTLVVRVAIVCTLGGLILLVAPVAAALLANYAEAFRSCLALRRARAQARRTQLSNNNNNNQTKGFTPWQISRILM